MDPASVAKLQSSRIQTVFSCCTAPGLPYQCSRLTLCTPLQPARSHCDLQLWAPCLEDLQLTHPWRAQWACVLGFACLPHSPYLKWHAGGEKLLWVCLCCQDQGGLCLWSCREKRLSDEIVMQSIALCPNCSYSRRKHWDAWPKGMT